MHNPTGAPVHSLPLCGSNSRATRCETNMAEPVSLSIQDLPTTVLSLCLEKLDDPRHLAAACSVCRLWREIASSSSSWKAFCGRWQHWNDAKYAEMRAAGQFNKVYPLRLKV